MVKSVVERLLQNRWPPILGLGAGFTVFLGILLTAPLGAEALVVLLLRPSVDEQTVVASYAVGAASFLGLAGLVVVTLLVALFAAARAGFPTGRREPRGTPPGT